MSKWILDTKNPKNTSPQIKWLILYFYAGGILAGIIVGEML